MQSCLICFSLFQIIWAFCMILAFFVQSFNTNWQLKWVLSTNEIPRYLGLRWVSGGGICCITTASGRYKDASLCTVLCHPACVYKNVYMRVNYHVAYRKQHNGNSSGVKYPNYIWNESMQIRGIQIGILVWIIVNYVSDTVHNILKVFIY